MQDFRSRRRVGSLSALLLPWEEWSLLYQVVPARNQVWEDTMSRVKNISRGRLVGPTGDGSRGNGEGAMGVGNTAENETEGLDLGAQTVPPGVLTGTEQLSGGGC